MVNHVSNHEILSEKHQLYESLTCYSESKKIDVFNYMPLTFTLQMDNGELCYSEF